MVKISDSEFLTLLLEDFSSTIESKLLGENIMTTFPINSIVLERKLENSVKIDISLPFFRANNDFSKLIEENSLNPKKNTKWNSVFSTIFELNTGLEFSFIQEVWFEFDENGSKNLEDCVPGIYLNSFNYLSENKSAIVELVDKLRAERSSKILINNIMKVLSLIAPGCEYMGVGVFLGRQGKPIRIGWLVPMSKVLEMQNLFPINNKILDYLKSESRQADEKIMVHFDVNEFDVNIQGIEIFSDDRKNWGVVYDSLAAHAFCDYDSKEVNIKWNDTYFTNTNIASTSQNTDTPLIYSQTFYCGINHFKLLNNKEAEVKVYHDVSFIKNVKAISQPVN